MKKPALFIGFFLLLTPAVSQAAAPSCSANGYTVVYVNGIFDTEFQAKQNRKALADALPSEFNNQPITVQLGYNPTHLAGAGDLVQSVAQLFGGSISRFDLDTILMQIYPVVTTRKLLLVGHSQGAFYTNSMYDYLLSHGEPDGAIAVYNVASAAAYTAGHGKYINSSGDTLLALLRAAHFDILPNNVDLVPTGSDGDYSGHAFASDYLAGASTQMLADMDGEMSNLQPTNASANGDCFTPPMVTFGYKATAAAFAVADPSATVLKAGTVTVVHASEVALNAATKVALGAVQLFSDSIVITAQPPTSAQTTANTEKIINKLYGSSLDGLSAQDKKDLLGSSGGAAVVVAVTPPAPKGLVLGTSTMLSASTSTEVDDASSTLIVPKNIFPASANGPVWTSGGASSGGGVASAPTLVIDPVAVTTPVVMDPAVATTTPVDTTPALVDVVDLQNPSLVINEIEWAGDMFDQGREWIEVKNRTASDIDLTGYVIYAKDGGNQYIPLAGTLPAYKNGAGFFVVERDGFAPLRNGSAQVFAFEQLADSGEQLALARVTSAGTTTIDMTPPILACNGWCAGSSLADQGETLSMERVSANTVGTDSSNWASNDTFTVTSNMPTPAGQPWKANGQPLFATPLQENSLHMPRVGFYCNPDTYPITPGAAYHPQTGQCTVMDRDIPYPGPLSAGVFKGVVGSSTQEGILQGLFRTGKVGSITVDFSDAQPGDQYFVAIWQPAFDASLGGGGACTMSDDYARMPSYFTTGHWLNRAEYCGPFVVDTTDVPDRHYEYIPFTYQP